MVIIIYLITPFHFICNKNRKIVRKSIIASSDIQQYKVIIFHSDNGVAESRFWKEYESLKIYLLQGGNLIISAGATLKTVHIQCGNKAFSIMEDYFGIPMNNDGAPIPVR